ncbi:MAG: type III pantothenate kinase [Pseudomonadota bacterium]|nr:type III pantothenate kinase [Pseudomonadota bacterium]
MFLLLDAGNTRIKWGVREKGDWLARGICPTGEASRLGEKWAAYPLNRALLSCVAGGATRASLETLLSSRVEQLRWVVAAARAHGVHSDYQPAESLGADRYAALVAARRRNLGACLVVSVGTALTVDALTPEGHFLGGCIAPGPDLMRAALLQGTAGVRAGASPASLTPLEATGQADCFPRSTGAALATGLALAQMGVVADMRERLRRHSGAAVTILLTGGARAILAAGLEPPLLEIDDLVLEGLVWMAKDLKWEDC